MDKLLFVNVQGNRKVSGYLRGFDIFLNLVLDDAREEGSADKVEHGTMVRFLLNLSACIPELIAFFSSPGHSRKLGNKHGADGLAVEPPPRPPFPSPPYRPAYPPSPPPYTMYQPTPTHFTPLCQKSKEAEEEQKRGMQSYRP